MLAYLGRHAVHLRLDRRQPDFRYVSGLPIAMANDVDDHLSPPPVAVAVAGHSISDAISVCRLEGDRFEARERLRLRIEAHSSVRR
jgi:hypothetical protein